MRLRLGGVCLVIVAVVAVVAFGSLLLVNGFVHATIGVDATDGPPDGSVGTVPASVRTGGPVIDASGTEVRSAGMPDLTIALTFDDGPDPRWTPEVLRVLARHEVPGTFFVVGSAVVRHPGVVRDIRAAGSEVGLHTFSHAALTTVSPEQVTAEMARTQLALAGAIGETSYLSRPPYASGPDSITPGQLDVIRLLGSAGELVVLSDLDSRDWERPGVDGIVRHSMPAGGRGAVVLLHDAGGDRSETLAALDRLIPELQDRGYRFTTVTQGLGLPPANRPADPGAVTTGTALLVVAAVATSAVALLEWLLVVAAVLVLVRLGVVARLARRHVARRRGRSWGRPVVRPVSVVVPAYNEEACIEATVRSLVASDHPVDVVVVDDGSTDRTAAIVRSLRLPGVRVVTQANAGKPAALNTGIALARHDLIVMMDGDTVFERSSVRHLVQPFADPAVGAVAGNAKVANRSGVVARLQHIEYVIGFTLDRRAYDLLGCMPTVPGAIGAFRRGALRDAGGVSDETLAEDTDLTMAVGAAGWRVVYQEDARAWTEVPETLSQLWRQRYRWSYGTMQSMWKHRRPGAAGRFGRFSLAHLALFQVFLPLLAPLIDVFLVYGLLFLDPWLTAAAWTAVLGLQLAVAAYAFGLDGESRGPLWLLPVQQVLYRQLMYLVLVRSAVTALGGVRLRWQAMHRSGAAGARRTAGLVRPGTQRPSRPRCTGPGGGRISHLRNPPVL